MSKHILKLIEEVNFLKGKVTNLENKIKELEENIEGVEVDYYFLEREVNYLTDRLDNI